jgi:hypothetical protein
MAAAVPLLMVQVCKEAREELICLGKNGARLVKGNPLCFEEDKPTLDRAEDSVGGASAETIAQIASKIVEELFNHINEGRNG